MALTDVVIRTSKPRATAFKLTDSAGLHLLITPAGGKLWRVSTFEIIQTLYLADRDRLKR